MKDKSIKEKEYYREKIIEMIGKIENPNILMKIHTFVKTHLEMLKEKEREV